MQGLFDTNEETQRLLGPTLLVYDSQMDRLAKLLTATGPTPDQPAEDVRALVAGLLAGRPVEMVRQQASDATSVAA